MHRISHMEKIMLAFEYEPLVFSRKLKTSYEEKIKGNINGARPSSTKTSKEELGGLIRGKDILKGEVEGSWW